MKNSLSFRTQAGSSIAGLELGKVGEATEFESGGVPPGSSAIRTLGSALVSERGKRMGVVGSWLIGFVVMRSRSGELPVQQERVLDPRFSWLTHPFRVQTIQRFIQVAAAVFTGCSDWTAPSFPIRIAKEFSAVVAAPDSWRFETSSVWERSSTLDSAMAEPKSDRRCSNRPRASSGNLRAESLAMQQRSH